MKPPFPPASSAVVPLHLIDDTPNEENPNQMSDEDFRGLVEAVRGLDFAQAVTLDKLPSGRYRIVDGSHRKRAATLVERESLPALVYDGLGDAQFRALRLALNRWRGELRPHVVQSEVLILHEAGFQREDLFAACGLTSEELDAILAPPPAAEQLTDDLDLPDPDADGPARAPAPAEDAACAVLIPCSSRASHATLMALFKRGKKASGARGKFSLEATATAALRAYLEG